MIGMGIRRWLIVFDLKDRVALVRINNRHRNALKVNHGEVHSPSECILFREPDLEQLINYR